MRASAGECGRHRIVVRGGLEATEPAAKNIAISTVAQKAAGNLKIEQPAPGKLIMDGDISGRKVRIESTLYDHSKWNIVSTQFRWVQDTPFNR